MLDLFTGNFFHDLSQKIEEDRLGIENIQPRTGNESEKYYKNYENYLEQLMEAGIYIGLENVPIEEQDKFKMEVAVD